MRGLPDKYLTSAGAPEAESPPWAFCDVNGDVLILVGTRRIGIVRQQTLEALRRRTDAPNLHP